MSEQSCAVEGCRAPAVRVIDGRLYCDKHRDYRPEVPVTWCAIDGCGSPAVARIGGRDLCRYHVGHDGGRDLPRGRVMPRFLGTRTSSRMPNNTPATRALTRDFAEQNKGGLNQLVASLSFGGGNITGANGTFASFGAVGDRLQVEGTVTNDGGFQVTAIDTTNQAFLTVAPAPKTQSSVTATLRKIT